jgi:transposase
VPEVPSVPDSGKTGLRAANTRLRELLAERDARLAGRDAGIAELRKQLSAVQSQLADLAAQVKTSSRNSSKPPSSDGLGKPAPKSLRGKSGRKPGRPKGQPGATMELSDHPDKTVRHRPARCSCCGKSLRKAPVTAVERRQVIDIPPVKAVTTEHQVLTVQCGCGCETKAQAPGGVNAPVQYGPRIMGTGIYLWHGQFLSGDRACQALSEMFGCAPSPGALAAAAKKTAGFLAPALQAITRHLIAAEVVHFDETGLRNFAHSAPTSPRQPITAPAHSTRSPPRSRATPGFPKPDNRERYQSAGPARARIAANLSSYTESMVNSAYGQCSSVTESQVGVDSDIPGRRICELTSMPVRGRVPELFCQRRGDTG